jgi:glucose-1-phosphate adenylyltransferase
VRIEAGAEVVDSILFEDVHVRRGARLHKVIIDKSSVIAERLEVGLDADRDGRNFKISKTGIRVVPKGWTSE